MQLFKQAPEGLFTASSGPACSFDIVEPKTAAWGLVTGSGGTVGCFLLGFPDPILILTISLISDKNKYRIILDLI